MQRATNEQIIEAYRQNGSVWRAAKSLGLCGQTVWERLKRLGVSLVSESWSENEVKELRELAPQCTIGEISRRLGRPYAGVACKISELGIGVRYGNSIRTRLKRGSGMTKAATSTYLKELTAFGGSIRQFCVQRGLSIELLVIGIQSHHPEGWNQYVRSHSDLDFKSCQYCSREFLPMNSRQKTCSRKCGSHLRSDYKYFGGKRRHAVGLEEGICQLCEKEKSNLAAHHVYGKENDPENDYMVALCPGCHQIVGSLGGRSDVTSPEMWENLIALAVTRKLGHRRPLGFHVCVEIDELSQSDIDEEIEMQEANAAHA